MLCRLFHSHEVLFNSNILVFVFRYEGANQVQWNPVPSLLSYVCNQIKIEISHKIDVITWDIRKFTSSPWCCTSKTPPRISGSSFLIHEYASKKKN